jgi:hypothetical protein
MHTLSPKKPILNKRCLPARKLMATVFWDRKGVLMVEFHATWDHNNIKSVLQNTIRTAQGH